MVSNDPEIYGWKVIHGFDGYDYQMTEKMLFTHVKKTSIHAVYQQKTCDSPPWK